MKRIFLITVISLMMISAVAAIDTEDWKTVTVENHDFKVPPKYADGEMKKGSYIVENWRVFQITEPGDSLPTMYGFAIDKGSSVEDLDINGHSVRYIKQYSEADNANLSRAFFSCGNSVYLISWLSDNFTEEVKEIIATADPSKISSDKFYEILDEAQEKHDEKESEPSIYYPTSEKTENNHYYLLSSYH